MTHEASIRKKPFHLSHKQIKKNFTKNYLMGGVIYSLSIPKSLCKDEILRVHDPY